MSGVDVGAGVEAARRKFGLSDFCPFRSDPAVDALLQSLPRDLSDLKLSDVTNSTPRCI